MNRYSLAVMSMLTFTLFAKDCPAPEHEQSYEQLFSELIAQHTEELASTLNEYRLEPEPPPYEEPTEEEVFHRPSALLEAKVGYFYPTNPQFRNLFSGGPIYGAEFTVPLGHYIYLFGSGNYFHQTGHGSKITLVPFALGLKQIYNFEKIDLHLGFGAEYGYWDVSIPGHNSNHRWNFGVLAQGGIILNATKHLFLDLFGNYSFLKMKMGRHADPIYRHASDVSGWTAGLGIGYRFGHPPCPKDCIKHTTP